MVQRVIRTNDLNPDGLRVVLDWGALSPGTSMFVPCINTTVALEQAKRITKKLDYDVILKVVIESKKLGIRIWRIA